MQVVEIKRLATKMFVVTNDLMQKKTFNEWFTTKVF
jgi:hypothetical protein